MGHTFLLDDLSHLIVWKACPTLDAALPCKAAMGLDNRVSRHASLALQAINILREEFQEKAFVRQQAEEVVREGRLILSWKQFVGQGVKWKRIVAKV